MDVSANGTDINHHVNTDLFDQNSHSIGEAATSRSFGRLTEGVVEDLEEDTGWMKCTKGCHYHM